MKVAIIGASGAIGQAVTHQLSKRAEVEKIWALSRQELECVSSKVCWAPIDITSESSIAQAAENIKNEIDEGLDLVVIASGLLHEGAAEDENENSSLLPEKSLKDLNSRAFETIFAVNCFGPALVFKHFLPLLPKDRTAICAALSARVGSISDNKAGGWYSYRASKAALNMLIKTASIELARSHKKACLIGYHPGTVDSALSAPFQSFVNHEIFNPEQAAGYFLDLLSSLTPEKSGRIFAWDGQEITP